MGKLEQRKRDRKQRKTKSIFVMGCEGKNKTETNYFKNFSSRESNFIIKFSTGTHTDPVGMANDLVDYIEKEDIKEEYGDKIYLLIDTDINQNKQKQIEEAKKICKKHKINLITSTPTFEYWYISHFRKTTKKYASSQDVKDEIRAKIPGYTESMNVYPLIKDKTQEAIKNAKSVEKYHIENGQAIDTEEANPHTSAYKIIEEINKNRE